MSYASGLLPGDLVAITGLKSRTAFKLISLHERGAVLHHFRGPGLTPEQYECPAHDELTLLLSYAEREQLGELETEKFLDRTQYPFEKSATYLPEMTAEQIAHVCHEANRAVCLEQGDASQPRWEEAPAWQRESATAGVHFRLANPDAPVWAQHEAWTNDKLQDGWVYGDVKDPIAKTHPCLVNFFQLPLHQQLKDELFTNIVNTLRPCAA